MVGVGQRDGEAGNDGKQVKKSLGNAFLNCGKLRLRIADISALSQGVIGAVALTLKFISSDLNGKWKDFGDLSNAWQTFRFVEGTIDVNILDRRACDSSGAYGLKGRLRYAYQSHIVFFKPLRFCMRLKNGSGHPSVRKADVRLNCKFASEARLTRLATIRPHGRFDQIPDLSILAQLLART